MSPLMLTLMIFGVMLVLMALRTPIAIAMFAAGTVGYVSQAGWAPLALAAVGHPARNECRNRPAAGGPRRPQWRTGGGPDVHGAGDGPAPGLVV